jgi:tetratricopeptide (TPR) repeat protein
LNRIEDIKYFETDSKLSEENVRSFGEQLRRRYHELIPGIVDVVALVDKKEFYPLHSDFCSRLGMTFDQGDYADNDAIPDKGRIAEKLYITALKYHPHPRAYLGLGIQYQKQNAYPESIKILSEGIEHFPRNEQINLCLSVSHMNLGSFETALSYLLKFQNSPQALEMIIHCYHALNDFKTASDYHDKLESFMKCLKRAKMPKMPKLPIYPVLNGEVEESAFSANQNPEILD